MAPGHVLAFPCCGGIEPSHHQPPGLFTATGPSQPPLFTNTGYEQRLGPVSQAIAGMPAFADLTETERLAMARKFLHGGF